MGLLQAGSGSGLLTRPASATEGVVARKELKVYLLIPHVRPVPVKGWSCTSWFGQWSPDPPGLCARRPHGPRPAACHLETRGQPNGGVRRPSPLPPDSPATDHSPLTIPISRATLHRRRRLSTFRKRYSLARRRNCLYQTTLPSFAC